jgi:hypothetical protein
MQHVVGGGGGGAAAATATQKTAKCRALLQFHIKNHTQTGI